MREIKDIKKELKVANKRLEKAAKAIAPKHKGGEMEEFEIAIQEVTILERELSMAERKETAFIMDWKAPWNTGAPSPHVISNEDKCFLIYLINQPDPHWDGTYANIIDSTQDISFPLALVEFNRCYLYQFGGMNDEVWEGHSLFKRGLEPYGAHYIENSKWLKKQKEINSIHRQYKEEWWDDFRHYFLLFHDTSFECLAKGHSIEIHQDSFKNVVNLATEKLFQE